MILSDLLIDIDNTASFQSFALSALRTIIVTGSTMDTILLSTMKTVINPMVSTQAELNIFLNDLNNNQTLVDEVTLGAIKNIFNDQTENLILYNQILSTLQQSILTVDQFNLFNNAIIIGGYNATSSLNNTANVTTFPSTAIILSQFQSDQLTKFQLGTITLSDFNDTTNPLSYIRLLGPIAYTEAENNAYLLSANTSAFNSLILSNFVPILQEKYINENLLISLHKNETVLATNYNLIQLNGVTGTEMPFGTTSQTTIVPSYEQILEDLIRYKINNS